jgi:hypothetical protein
MQTRRLWLPIVLGALVCGTILAQLSSGKAYPACDNTAARAALARLYDNRCLLHAVVVSDLHLLSDSWKGRYCAANVTWGDATTTEVHYAFHRGGRQNRDLEMWIDYNGGMRGPSF